MTAPTTPAISGWTYGEIANTPVGAAKYGEVSVEYTGTANDGTQYSSATAPAKAGSYTVTITVEAKNMVVNTEFPIYTYKVEGLLGEDTLVTEPTITCNADITVVGEYDITAADADACDNYSIKYVPAKLTVLTDNAVDAAAGYAEELKDYDPATATSEDKTALEDILGEIDTILSDATITDSGKKALNEVKEQVENLIKEIEDALAEPDKSEDTTSPNTGDINNLWLWFALLFVSGAGIFGITLCDRKRKVVNKK